MSEKTKQTKVISEVREKEICPSEEPENTHKKFGLFFTVVKLEQRMKASSILSQAVMVGLATS
jgi:hypothetical protein